MQTTSTVIDICIFAHNEAETVDNVVQDVAAQTLMKNPDLDVRVLVLANGCADDTVARGRAACEALPAPARDRISVIELAQGGKSRTWNHFTHSASRAEATLLMFMDADIRLPRTDTLARMVAAMAARPELRAFSSQPVKDLVHHDIDTGFSGRLIAASAGMLSDWRSAISGSLHVQRAAVARTISMPVGLPVEDGFLRAMILTDLLTGPERLERIDGEDGVFHVYESTRTIKELIQHQTRIVIGGSVNSALFRLMRRDAPGHDQAQALLEKAAADDAWLANALRQELPRAPFGYVPFHFLVKRLNVARRPGWRVTPKNLLLLALGFGFDALVYVNASAKMARGAGAGHW